MNDFYKYDASKLLRGTTNETNLLHFDRITQEMTARFEHLFNNELTRFIATKDDNDATLIDGNSNMEQKDQVQFFVNKRLGLWITYLDSGNYESSLLVANNDNFYNATNQNGMIDLKKANQSSNKSYYDVFFLRLQIDNLAYLLNHQDKLATVAKDYFNNVEYKNIPINFDDLDGEFYYIP